MRLPTLRAAPATLTLAPERPVRPTETVTAAVALRSDLDDVRSARVELGYVNAYRCRWAGRRDAALRHDDTALFQADQAGTDHGSDRETTDWVHALDVALPVADGRLAAGTYPAALRLPSWAPGSSARAVRWEARLRVERRGRDVAVEAPIEVLVAAPVPPPEELPLVQGESAIANDLEFTLRTEGPCWRAGEDVRGVVGMTPKVAITRSATLGFYFVCERLSHPLERAPGATTEHRTRPTVRVAEDLHLVEGQTTEVAFAVALPDDADPTTEAVHSSLRWCLVAQVEFSGLTGGIERATRGIVVHTA